LLLFFNRAGTSSSCPEIRGVGWSWPGAAAVLRSQTWQCHDQGFEPCNTILLFERFSIRNAVPCRIGYWGRLCRRQARIDFSGINTGITRLLKITLGNHGPKRQYVIGACARTFRLQKPRMQIDSWNQGMSGERAYSEVKELAVLRNSPGFAYQKTIDCQKRWKVGHPSWKSCTVWAVLEWYTRSHPGNFSERSLIWWVRSMKAADRRFRWGEDGLSRGKTLSILKMRSLYWKNTSIQIDLDKIRMHDLKTGELFSTLGKNTIAFFNLNHPHAEIFAGRTHPIIEDLTCD